MRERTILRRFINGRMAYGTMLTLNDIYDYFLCQIPSIIKNPELFSTVMRRLISENVGATFAIQASCLDQVNASVLSNAENAARAVPGLELVTATDYLTKISIFKSPGTTHILRVAIVMYDNYHMFVEYTTPSPCPTTDATTHIKSLIYTSATNQCQITECPLSMYTVGTIAWSLCEYEPIVDAMKKFKCFNMSVASHAIKCVIESAQVKTTDTFTMFMKFTSNQIIDITDIIASILPLLCTNHCNIGYYVDICGVVNRLWDMIDSSPIRQLHYECVIREYVVYHSYIDCHLIYPLVPRYKDISIQSVINMVTADAICTEAELLSTVGEVLLLVPKQNNYSLSKVKNSTCIQLFHFDSGDVFILYYNMEDMSIRNRCYLYYDDIVLSDCYCGCDWKNIVKKRKIVEFLYSLIPSGTLLPLAQWFSID